MSNIPRARKLLEDVLDELTGREYYAVKEALSLMHRQPPVRKTPPRSRPMTWELRQEISEYIEDHPSMSNQEIAVEFEVNAGRISEIANASARD